MKLDVNVGSVRNVFPVMRRSYLLHDVGNVGIVSRVKSISDVIIFYSPVYK